MITKSRGESVLLRYSRSSRNRYQSDWQPITIQTPLRSKSQVKENAGSTLVPRKESSMDIWRFQRHNEAVMPNKSPEPTAVGAVSSAIAVHVANRRWRSFLR